MGGQDGANGHIGMVKVRGLGLRVFGLEVPRDVKGLQGECGGILTEDYTTLDPKPYIQNNVH